ncbi:MAG: FHA domain-containing protein [Planctomycetes bacterium]|nr:FHA domain-containing protein [Planctomycetota bacterium]
MPATLRWNRLVIAAESEEEFISAVFDYFPQLLQLPYDEVEMDITGTAEISEDAFRSIAIKLIGGEASDKKVLIRIPPSVDRYFRHANLYRMVTVDVIHDIPRNGKVDPAKIKANIAAGKYDSVKGAKPAPDLTERAPAELAPEAPSLDPVPKKKSPTAARQTNKASRPADKATKADVGFLVDVESGSRHEIRKAVMIGREPPSDLVYQIPTISKRHFQVRKDGDGFLIEDMRSTNGTYLNGLPVHEPVPLRDGDEIVVAITLKHPKGARIFQFTTRPE